MKKTMITLVLLVAGTCVLLAQGNTQKTEQCPLALADIESVFGKGFSAGETRKIGDILSCKFSNEDYSIQISINSGYGMKIDDYNKMMSPATVTWKPVPNDPDQARIEIRDDKKDDLASTPCVTYIRKDKYVRLQVLGNYYGYDQSKMAKLRDEMREKLAKLKHVP